MAEYIRQDHHLPHGSFEPHITNGDRLRAMTDEELATWMYEHMACRYCPCMPCVSSDDIDEEGNIKCTPCEQILLEWLRKEATSD